MKETQALAKIPHHFFLHVFRICTATRRHATRDPPESLARVSQLTFSHTLNPFTPRKRIF